MKKEKKENSDFAVVESQSVKLVGNPQDRLNQANEAAKALMTVAQPVSIQGKPYLTIKDWQTIGSFYGLFAGADEAEPVNIDNITGFRAKAVIRTADGTIISSAMAYCLDEGVWKGREKFAQASMAQTRAASKALRNCVGWVAHLAGYEDTPAEEMDFQDKGITQSHAQSVSQNGAKTPKTDLVCPLCSKSVVDKRVWENGAWTRQTSQKGNKFPAFQCIDNDDFKNPTCKGVIWDDPGADLKIEKPPHQNDIVEDDDLEEAEELAKQAEKEVLPF